MYTFNNQTLNEQYEYKTAKIKRLTSLEECNLPKSWHGGNVFRMAELQDIPLVIFVNFNDRTIDVGVMEENINKLTPELIDLLKEKYPNIETDSKFKCKVEGCAFETDNKGIYLAHCREHKKAV
jgi:hypothetical protein